MSTRRAPLPRTITRDRVSATLYSLSRLEPVYLTQKHVTRMSQPICKSSRLLSNILKRRITQCHFQAKRSIATHTFSQHASSISILPSKTDTFKPEFKENARQMADLMARMNALHASIQEGGPTKAKEKHVARGKILPREYALVESTLAPCSEG